MRILISGGAGFIGTKLTDALLAQGHSVTILDNMLEQVHGCLPNTPKVPLIRGDVAEAQSWRLAFESDPEAVFHLAAKTGTAQSMAESASHTTTNITGTAALLDHLNTRKHSVKKVVLTSSCAIYGNQTFPSPLSVYGLSKLVQENLLETACPVPYSILRLQNVYGPGQSPLNPHTGIITSFTKKMAANENVEIYNNGKPVRDFVFVSDVVSALVLALETKGIYDIGSGVLTPIIDMARLLKTIMGSSSEITTTSYHRPGDVIYISSITHGPKLVGWEPKVSLREGLEKTVEWFRSR